MRNAIEAGSPSVHHGREAWAGPESPLADFIRRETKGTLASYGNQPNLVYEHVNQEHDTARGGYADRQIIELVQNSADALLQAESGRRRISIRLSGDNLYCADDGLPVDESGITALMFAHLSSKRDTAAIGRFGLGFKSVLGVTDAPEFYSRSVSFRFGREHARQVIEAATGREFRDYPVLRLPESLDPCRAEDEDGTLGELMSWATNIVRLPLLERGVGALRQQIRDFPAEFLLLVHHVRELHLDDGQSISRYTLRQQSDAVFELLKADVSQVTEQTSRWRIFQTMHTLSVSARSDRRSLDDSNEVPITWAASLDVSRDVGHFWAYFPTRTASLVGGILNAPWKTNEDRQNLLSGPYNDEIIRLRRRWLPKRSPGSGPRTIRPATSTFCRADTKPATRTRQRSCGANCSAICRDARSCPTRTVTSRYLTRFAIRPVNSHPATGSTRPLSNGRGPFQTVGGIRGPANELA